MKRSYFLLPSHTYTIVCYDLEHIASLMHAASGSGFSFLFHSVHGVWLGALLISGACGHVHLAVLQIKVEGSD